MTKANDAQANRIEELVHRVGQLRDPDARATAEHLMQAVLDWHGSGLEQMMELISESREAGEAIFRRFANDPLVSGLLVLHGLHPDNLETRVRQALAKLPGRLELVAVFDDQVRVRILAGNTRESVEASLRDALPDAAQIVAEESLQANGFVPLATLGTLTSTPV